MKNQVNHLQASIIFFSIISLFFISCASTDKAKLATGWTELGNAWANLNKWDKAGEAWSKALQLDPGQGIAAYNLVRALAEAGKYDEAINKCQVYIKNDPDNASILSILAYALYKDGRNTEAIDIYIKVTALNAADTASLFNLAVLFEANGQDDEALQRYDAILKVKPSDPDVSYRKALIMASKDDFETAISLLNIYIQSNKDSTKALSVLAFLQEQAKLYSDAIDTYKNITTKDPKDGASWFALARLRLTIASDTESGLAALQSAIDNGFSDKGKAQTLLSALTGTTADKAKEIFEKAKLLEAENAEEPSNTDDKKDTPNTTTSTPAKP